MLEERLVKKRNLQLEKLQKKHAKEAKVCCSQLSIKYNVYCKNVNNYIVIIIIIINKHSFIFLGL